MSKSSKQIEEDAVDYLKILIPIYLKKRCIKAITCDSVGVARDCFFIF